MQLAANFGFTITADDISDNVPFVAGGARAGDRLTNGPWIYTFIIRLPFTEATKFLAGQGRAGDRLFNIPNSRGARVAFERLAPLFFQDIMDGIEDSGVTGALKAAPAVLGTGVTTFDRAGR